MDPQALHAISLAAAEERSVEGVLRLTVEGLAAHPGMALARIWLMAPGNTCPICMQRGQGDSAPSLHVVASAGASLDGKEAWRRLDGEFHRFNPGERKIGQVAAQGSPLLFRGPGPAETGWPLRQDWAAREKILRFAGYPLLFHGSVLGVLAVFCRTAFDDPALLQLAPLAERAAVALVNSRAFAELEGRARDLEQQCEYLREEVSSFAGYGGVIGTSRTLGQVLRQAELVAATQSTVLLLGESGTGKELFARFIHDRSTRSAQPLIKVNCGSIPRELFESEFFGHVKGSFTGAVRDRVGRFQLSDRGTLFLDEVGEIPLELQAKLLRALQEGEFERIGDARTLRVDVRVVAATNRDLRAEVAAGRFREDLYYRLSVFPLEIPPLRERPEDIPALAAFFVEQARRTVGRPAFQLSAADLEALRSYRWPGNVRELANLIERAAILSPGGRNIALADLLPRAPDPQAPPPPRADPDILTESDLRERERLNLIRALERARGKVYGRGGAAELLGMKPTTLSSRLRSLGIRGPGR